MNKLPQPTLFIKNGKIVNQQGETIAPEIGNTEHISLTKKYNSAIEFGISEFSINATIDVDVNSDCLCGNRIYFKKYDIDIDVDNNGFIDQDISDAIRGAKAECHNCHQKYKVAIDQDGNIMIRMIAEVPTPIKVVRLA